MGIIFIEGYLHQKNFLGSPPLEELTQLQELQQQKIGIYFPHRISSDHLSWAVTPGVTGSISSLLEDQIV